MEDDLVAYRTHKAGSGAQCTNHSINFTCGQESPGQFMVRLKNYFKWVELSKVEKTFDGVVELMVRERFTNACFKDLSVYLNERSPKRLAEQYLMAHDKKLSSKDVMARQGDTRGFGRGKSTESFCAVVRCYCCGLKKHRAAKCVSRTPVGHRRDGQQGRRILAADVELLDMKL